MLFPWKIQLVVNLKYVIALIMPVCLLPYIIVSVYIKECTEHFRDLVDFEEYKRVEREVERMDQEEIRLVQEWCSRDR